MSVCVNCRTPLVVIELMIGDTPTRMASCSSCGRRRWSASGDVVTLGDVLSAASEGGPPRSDRTRPPVA